MKYSPLYFVGLLLLIVSSIEKEFDPDTKYFIYNKVTSNCIKRQLTDNGYSEYYIITYGKCTGDDDSLWYIKDNHIVSAANGNCFAIVNSSKLGSKDCDKQVIEAQYSQNFVFEGETICTNQGNCLKDKRGYTGSKESKDEYYEWVISTSLPESE